MTQFAKEQVLPRTLYLTRNGLMEALGRSQVLAYLRGLSRDYRVTVISFEKPEDLADLVAFERTQRECEALGIQWLPQRFRYKPKVVASVLDMTRFALLGFREIRSGARLIHARSYIPSAVALLLNRLTGVPFIFDMRALWPEELITAGRLRRGSITHRAIVWVERACLNRSATVVSLTHAAEKYLRTEYPDETATQNIVVIPTCADLDRFVPLSSDTPTSKQKVFGCLGTVLSGWFRIDWLAAFFRCAAEREPDARFQIVTQDDPALVRAAIGGGSDFQEKLLVEAVPPQQVHTVVQRQAISVMFFTEGLGKLGSSPTRMAEVLGCGIPVVANAGVGDVARIVADFRVGVLVADGSDLAMHEALDALCTLMADPDLGGRCRAAAEAVFSLGNGTEAYRKTYRRIVEGGAECASGARS